MLKFAKKEWVFEFDGLILRDLISRSVQLTPKMVIPILILRTYIFKIRIGISDRSHWKSVTNIENVHIENHVAVHVCSQMFWNHMSVMRHFRATFQETHTYLETATALNYAGHDIWFAAPELISGQIQVGKFTRHLLRIQDIRLWLPNHVRYNLEVKNSRRQAKLCFQYGSIQQKTNIALNRGNNKHLLVIFAETPTATHPRAQ